jgi:hypothetical protein
LPNHLLAIFKREFRLALRDLFNRRFWLATQSDRRERRTHLDHSQLTLQRDILSRVSINPPRHRGSELALQGSRSVFRYGRDEVSAPQRDRTTQGFRGPRSRSASPNREQSVSGRHISFFECSGPWRCS